MTQELPIEGPAEAELNRLIEMLGKNEVIVRYQEAEENTKDNRALEQLVETIKSKQKETAAFEHYAKPAAAAKTAAEQAVEGQHSGPTIPRSFMGCQRTIGKCHQHHPTRRR